jgi:hypothetical protein
MPLPPNLANGRMHWRVKNRRRAEFFDRCDLLYPHRLVPMVDRVELRAHLYVGGQMDDDNALARIKWAADWLVTRMYLTSDKRPHCVFTIPEQTIDRKNPRLEITLSPAPTPRTPDR